MRYGKGGRLKAQNTKKTKCGHREGSGYRYALNDGAAAKAGDAIGADGVIDRGVANIDVAHRPAPHPRDGSIDIPRYR